MFLRKRAWAVSLAVQALCVLAAQPSQKPAEVARKAVDLLLAEKYPELRAMLTPTAQEKLTLDFLHDRVGGEIRTFGQLNSVGEPVIAQDGDNTLVSFPAQFAAAKINIQLTLNPSLPGVGSLPSSGGGALAEDLAAALVQQAGFIHAA